MTPMVDLAFLLLTFFILTATFNQSKIMKLSMPEKADDATPEVNINDALNLVLADNNRIYWWIGPGNEVNLTNYSKTGIRQILLEKKGNKKLYVLIKPKDDSKYENMVDILDEMEITGIERYAIVEFSEEDKIKLSQ